MRRIIVIAALAVFVAVAIAATMSTRGHKAQADTHPTSAHVAPSHSRAFWVHRNQP